MESLGIFISQPILVVQLPTMVTGSTLQRKLNVSVRDGNTRIPLRVAYNLLCVHYKHHPTHGNSRRQDLNGDV